MNQDTIEDQCTDPTQELSIKIPCRLAARVESYAQETDNTIEGVVIDALDQLLRNRTSRSE
ncbi:MAG: hypothetical protein ABIL58_24770 [Pseudomonadota bacterium]